MEVIAQKWMVCRENPNQMDELGVPPFQETSISRGNCSWVRLVDTIVAMHKLTKDYHSPLTRAITRQSDSLTFGPS